LLTGLRPSEAVESVKLIQNSETFTHYYDSPSMTLCHYKFKDQVLRATKKAFLLYITLDNLQPIRDLGPKTPTYSAIRSTCKRRSINMDMRLTRKLFASWLIQVGGIDSNTVDLLSGRVPQSVLVRHYQSPSNNLKDRILDEVNKLKNMIEA
jgi:intergrase/recombinase